MATASPKRGYEPAKDELRKRLRRVEGQVRGVERMIDEDRWCPEILVQIAAIAAALDSVALKVTEGHVQHCMAAAGADAEARTAMTAELMGALARLVRS